VLSLGVVHDLRARSNGHLRRPRDVLVAMSEQLPQLRNGGVKAAAASDAAATS
jgi:hypothetical protein